MGGKIEQRRKKPKRPPFLPGELFRCVYIGEKGEWGTTVTTTTTAAAAAAAAAAGVIVPGYSAYKGVGQVIKYPLEGGEGMTG